MCDSGRLWAASGRVSRLMGRSLHRAFRVFVWVCLLGGVAVACSGGINADAGAGESSDGLSAEHASQRRSDGSELFAGYTEDEIGVGILVDAKLAGRHILAQYRTYEDHRLASAAENSVMYSGSPAARDRAFFEQVVSLLFLGAGDIMPAEVGDADKELWHAFYRSLDLCVERSEWPDIELYRIGPEGDYYDTAFETVQLYQQQYGMTLDEFIDFEHECHKFAASYPVLDGEYRDELLKTRRDYYLEVLRLWMRDHPEMVVPLDYENSVNQPYQDYVRQQCTETEDPEACVEGEGVSYR
jgi:hypothetical protein